MESALNEVSFTGQSPRYESEPKSDSPAPYQVAAAATPELAQQILMGMQSDIEAQIDWRFKQRAPKARGLDPSEIGVVLGSIGMAVPLTAIAGAAAGLPGIIAICLMLIIINVVWATRS
jgi:hypothetical protein